MLIGHATDLSGDDRAALLHAAALAVATGGRLVSVYDGHASGSVPIEELEARWRRRIVHELRRIDDTEDVADVVSDVLRTLAPGLVVVGTHARHGLSALVRPSISEAIARNVDVPVLFVPNGCRGFVDADTGAIALRRIIIPAHADDDAAAGTAAARAVIASLSIGSPELQLLRVDDERAIVAAAGAAPDGCLVVMATRGHDGVGDVLRGSHTERVIRDARCAVLSSPRR
jgi:nucleotide-binding universal stress UspA family protein